jgi:arginyl-tRNA synthetase
MTPEAALRALIIDTLSKDFQIETSAADLRIERTNPDFPGDFTLVVFPLVKALKRSPEQCAELVGEALCKRNDLVSSFNVVKGFLNLELAGSYWVSLLQTMGANALSLLGSKPRNTKVMVEYSSPNTNKPLHLGHVRNNLLGWSVAEILKADGYEVIKANLINDRGIHICKSMIAWERFGNGETPESSGMKGDHLVGKYYVAFDAQFRAEVAELVAAGIEKEAAEKQAPILLAAQDMLRRWEQGDEAVLKLWKTMNSWVYAGFESSYSRLGVDFDRYYYESNTYTLGKDIIAEGLEKGVFYRKPDGSVWIDLREDGLDEKLVLRSDGTSVYMTQDIGTAELKYAEYGIDRSVYVVGNEQDYHFKVLRLIMQKLGRPYADGIFHLSYGMVDLPSGKMKSREGTVVDADDLMQEMHDTARRKTEELGKTEGMTGEALSGLYEMLGMAALKFFMLKVDPQKRMLFNPQESIDFQGDTGPFIQYTYARIRSMLRQTQAPDTCPAILPNEAERAVIRQLAMLPDALRAASDGYDPSPMAHWSLQMARQFNRFYNEFPVLKEADEASRAFRLFLANAVAENLRNTLGLLGIAVPEKM